MAEKTTQLNQNDWKPGKNVAITANSIVFGLSLRHRKGVQFCSRYIKRGTILVKISILKGKALNLQAEPPLTKLYWVPPWELGKTVLMPTLISRFVLNNVFLSSPLTPPRGMLLSIVRPLQVVKPWRERLVSNHAPTLFHEKLTLPNKHYFMGVEDQTNSKWNTNRCKFIYDHNKCNVLFLEWPCVSKSPDSLIRGNYLRSGSDAFLIKISEVEQFSFA